jgi:hypothetical protein
MPLAKGTGGAEFDASEVYRYRLWREWDAALPRIVFVMLNPSTADAERNDPTIRRCIGYAERWGFGSLEAVNLFAYRSTQPHHLKTAADPVGPENDRYLLEAVARADQVLLAWGNGGMLLNRGERVITLLKGRATLYCLGKTQSGHPLHPLHQSGHLMPHLLNAEL